MLLTITISLSLAALLVRQYLADRRLRRLEKMLRGTYKETLFIHDKINNLMTKQDFLQAMADLKTEVGTVSAKVDVLEQKINGSTTDVDPDVVAAFNDLKTSVDALSTKADNTPAAPAEETPAGSGS